MSQLIIEPHYLGSLEYFCLFPHHQIIVLEVHDKFQKQTFRNRCYLLSSNKVLPLIVPVSYSSKSLVKEVVIDNSQRWKKDHWGAVYSSYGKAPYFEFFADMINDVWRKNHKFLVDLNIEFLSLLVKILQLDVKLTLSEQQEKKTELDLRNFITPKRSFVDRKIYQPIPYSQLFGDKFSPNLSIIDLIMCEGPNASSVLSASFLKR